MIKPHRTSFQLSDLQQKMETYLTSPLVKSFLAGSFSGTCSTILFQPLDLVKTRIQIYKEPGHATGILRVAGHVIKSETLVGLWKGVVPSLTRTVPGIGVYFCSMHSLRSNFGSADPHPLESIAIGVMARSVSGISMLPITVIKTRYESGRFGYQSMRHALVTIYKTEGAAGLFSGLSATLLRDAPFSGIYLMFYTQTKKMVKTSGIENPNSPLVTFLCGTVAGCLASVVTQPADVVKTHMQLDSSKFGSVRRTIVYIYNQDGLKGFMRGGLARTLRRTMMSAMAWTVYEQAMQSFRLK